MARKLTTAERRWHRKMAAGLFNEVWRLLEKKRTPAEDDRMIHAAHASRYHWGEVGTPVNLAIGEWQISHVYAVLDRPEPATYHAVRSLAMCKETASTTSRSPSPTRPSHAPTRSPAGSATCGGIWPSHERLARRSRTRRIATSCSKTSGRFDPVCVVDSRIPFRPESGLFDAPHPGRASPIRRRTHDLDDPLERRGVEDERLELPALPARMDPAGLLQAEEISDDPIVPSPSEPARVEAFR